MPRSLNSEIESLICSTFSSVGPTMMPTRICPITSGSCAFRQISPETVVNIKMAHSEMMNVAISLAAFSRTRRVPHGSQMLNILRPLCDTVCASGSGAAPPRSWTGFLHWRSAGGA